MPERTLPPANGITTTTNATNATNIKPSPAAPTADGNSIQQPPLHQVCSSLNTRISTFLASPPPTDRLRNVQEQTRISLGVLQEALSQYGPSELSISYNGGKDCLVLLVLFLAALDRWSQSQPQSQYPPPPKAQQQQSQQPSLSKSLQSVYIIPPHPFAEVDSFVDYSVHAYALDLARYAMPMKLAFETYLHERPRVKAILVGTRRTDPHGGALSFFDKTDHGWPVFMRVHPVIDWHYAEIWAGYTSLGGTTDTHPNPALLETPVVRLSGKEGLHFRPAYELVEDEEERLGRDRATSMGIQTPRGS
ncbi:hypothetical protein FGG08_000368 [Glutinoglossum americanum]|uniref:FAD synthase n=1 Tax=Glutinoglossum americanum TaxID=1670608 RepID=A0A9P8IAC7_9PEZI|nr:hypothetical protein FGG08_000368 [Glutinoglossum americanum]